MVGPSAGSFCIRAPPADRLPPLRTRASRGASWTQVTCFRQVCVACAEKARERQALFLRSLGSPGVDAATVPKAALDAGIEIEGPEVVFGGADEADFTRIEGLPSGRLELRGECVDAGGQRHEVFGPSPPLPPATVKNPSRFWIEQHRAELARLKRGEFKETLP